MLEAEFECRMEEEVVLIEARFIRSSPAKAGQHQHQHQQRHVRRARTTYSSKAEILISFGFHASRGVFSGIIAKLQGRCRCFASSYDLHIKANRLERFCSPT